MSQHACKLLTDDGVFYVAFCTTLDQFISPAHREISKVAEVLCNLSPVPSIDEIRTDADDNVFDLRSGTCHRNLELLAKLQRGVALTDQEAAEVYRFNKFLWATVAPHQEGFKSGDEKADAWILELGLRTKIPEIKEYDTWEIVTDRACFPAFQVQCYQNHTCDGDEEMLAKTLPEQRMLAGLYVYEMALYARLIGSGKVPPARIVDTFFNKHFPS